MRIIVVGGRGTIGSAVVKELSARHEVLIACRHGGDLTCDLTSEASIRGMFTKVGKCDAVVTAVGHVVFKDFHQMTAADYHTGLSDKLMGQVNVVLIGKEFIQEGGSFTLTSGILSHDPIRAGSSAAMVNGAVEGFVIGAAIEMPRRLRINCICPTILQESMAQFEPYFRGFDAVPASKVGLAYAKSVEGHQTGQIYKVLF